MIKILFVRRPKAYLPEIDAYIDFLKIHYTQAQAFDTGKMTLPCNAADFDIIWHFMGTNHRREGRFVVHEYNSLSAGAFPRFKNWVKTRVNCAPDRRVFLSPAVKEGFGFEDGVPERLRDMGVSPAFFNTPRKPNYDFVYAGSVHRGLEVIKMLDRFKDELKGSTIYIVGSVNPEIQDRYAGYGNIVFAGRVPYTDVPMHMARGRYGLNLVPDRYPFNIQTATKVLEYCALGLPVVSMRYKWSENFVERSGGSFFWLNDDFSNITKENLDRHDFRVPDVSVHSWESVISQSQIFDFLQDF